MGNFYQIGFSNDITKFSNDYKKIFFSEKTEKTPEETLYLGTCYLMYTTSIRSQFQQIKVSRYHSLLLFLLALDICISIGIFRKKFNFNCNPFLSNIPYPYQRFPDDFRNYNNGTLG